MKDRAIVNRPFPLEVAMEAFDANMTIAQLHKRGELTWEQAVEALVAKGFRSTR